MPLFSIEHPELLTPEELVRARSRSRRRWLLAALTLLLLTASVWQARPLVRAVKSWHSRRLAGEALAFIDHQQWTAARDKAADAYAFSSTEPMAIRAVGRLLARGQGSGALPYYRQLRTVDALTPEDRRDFAASALSANDLPDASEQSDWLLAHRPAAADAPPADLLLAAQVASAQGKDSPALDFASHLLADPTATETQQFTAAVRLVNAAATQGQPEGPKIAPVWERIRHLADSRGPVGLDALTLLSRRPVPDLAQPPAAGWMPLEDIARALAAHPLATPAQQLLALDLSAGADPASRAATIDTAVARWRHSDDAGLSALAAWLLAKGESARTLDVLPADRAARDTTLFAHRLNALAGTRQWAEIKTVLSATSCPLDESSRHMYLASARAHLDDGSGANFEWGRAQDATFKDPNRLYALGQYAESQAAREAAKSAYAAAISAAPQMRAAHLALCRVADALGQTAAAQQALAATLALWPQDDATNDAEAYHRLLLGAAGADARAIERTAAALAAREKGNWQVRATLSLARLRLGEVTGALQAFAGLRAAETPSVPPGALAVRAVAMAAAGWKVEAKAEARTLASTSLRPEEYALIAPLLAE